MHISIHPYRSTPFDEDYIARLISKSIPHKIAQCLKSAGEFETLLYMTEGLIFGSFRNQNFDPKIIEANAKLIIQTIKNNFDIAQSSSNEVQIELANQTSTITKKKYNPWLFYEGYYYSFIFRSINLREYLNVISYEKYLVTYTEHDLFNVCHYDVLRGLGKLKQEELIRKFNSGFKHLFALKQSLTTNHFRIFYPLWEYIIREDNKRFNEKLEEALLQHKKIWSNREEDEDADNDPLGHRNVELCGIMSYAKDIGFHLDHTSDYTPQYLVDGNCKVDLGITTAFMFTPNEISQEEIVSNLIRRFKNKDQI